MSYFNTLLACAGEECYIMPMHVKEIGFIFTFISTVLILAGLAYLVNTRNEVEVRCRDLQPDMRAVMDGIDMLNERIARLERTVDPIDPFTPPREGNLAKHYKVIIGDTTYIASDIAYGPDSLVSFKSNGTWNTVDTAKINARVITPDEESN